MSVTIESFLHHPEEIHRLYDWIFDTIHPLIRDRVFVVYSGNGEFPSRLIDHGFTVQLNASSEPNREFLRQKFKDSPLVRGIHMIDFLSEELEDQYSHFARRFSTVLVCDDFAENVHHDKKAIDKAKRLISDEGCLIVSGQCPTTFFPGAYQDIDLLKRYNGDSIHHLLNGLTILQSWLFGFNGACFISVAKKA